MNERVSAVYLNQFAASNALDAAQLMQAYQSGASVFASPKQTVLAQCTPIHLSASEPDQLVNACQQLLLESAPGSVLMGALPFNNDVRPSLGLAQHVLHAQGPCSLPPLPNLPGVADVLNLPESELKASKVHYQHSIEQALAMIAAGKLEKIVLARAMQLPMEVDIYALLQRLAARNRYGYTFAMPLQDGDAHLVGASPELLLSREGAHICSHPLAGSIPRSSDPHEDQLRARQLLQSGKDLREHRLVVDAVLEALAPFCRKLVPPRGPSLTATATMWHLGTPIYGQLRELDCSSLQLALALHPTPAVCGHPQATAREAIAQLENFARRYYAGLVGWCDAKGNGEWAVSLRCAEIRPQQATVYAGAGIVAGSDVELEWQETSGKMRTMLNALEMVGKPLQGAHSHAHSAHAVNPTQQRAA